MIASASAWLKVGGSVELSTMALYERSDVENPTE